MKSAAAVVPIPSSVLDRRITIHVFSTATYSNPGGDPERENHPRRDPETQHGIITPMCFKRKLRDNLALAGYSLYITRENVALETFIRGAIESSGVNFKGEVAEGSEDDDDAEEPEEKKAKGKPKGSKLTQEEKARVTKELCLKFIDNRFFGSTFCNPINQPMTGPVQVGMSVSVDPVEIIDSQITRMVVTKESDLHKEKTFGRLAVVPFGLYRTEIDLNPVRAKLTGFTWADYDLFMTALRNLYEHSKSTGRAGMEIEKIVVFMHDSPLGNASSKSLRRRVTAVRKNPKGLPPSELSPPRSADDYEISVDTSDLKGIEVEIIDP